MRTRPRCGNGPGRCCGCAPPCWSTFLLRWRRSRTWRRPDALALLARAPDPARAAKLTRGQLVAALRAARRHHVEAKADALLAVLRAPALRQPATLQGAYAAVVVGQVGIITALNEQIAGLQEVMAEHFGRHPAAEIYLSQPGFGVVLAARTLGEFGDDKDRFANARARKNYSGQSPITRVNPPACPETRFVDYPASARSGC
ncbi:MAG: hypothetical protein WKF47_05730 [Geodermatophilaceae bacterium]